MPGRRCRAAGAETIVVYTPHGLCVEGLACVGYGDRCDGELTGSNGHVLRASLATDTELADAVAEDAEAQGVSAARVVCNAPDGEPVAFPLDFGVLIPLRFLLDGAEPPRILVVCPARDLTRDDLVAFGRITVEAAERLGRRIAIVCSADQGHGHAADGPYGLSPNSPEYDDAYCSAVRDHDLARLLDWGEEWIESALPDSYWQTLMLHGALTTTPTRVELLSYEAPTYFGMACAEFRPA